MIQTLREPKLRTPPQPVGHVPAVESSTSTPTLITASAQTNRTDDLPAQSLGRDPAALASSLRNASITTHHALKAGADAATMRRLSDWIAGIEQGFCDLGLDDLARFTANLKRAVEADDQG